MGDARFYEQGPYFIRQPNPTVFNMGRQKVIKDVSLLCLARGWTTLMYKWYSQTYLYTLVAQEVDSH